MLIDLSDLHLQHAFFNGKHIGEWGIPEADATKAMSNASRMKEVLVQWRGKVPLEYCYVIDQDSGNRLMPLSRAVFMIKSQQLYTPFCRSWVSDTLASETAISPIAGSQPSAGPSAGFQPQPRTSAGDPPSASASGPPKSSQAMRERRPQTQERARKETKIRERLRIPSVSNAQKNVTNGNAKASARQSDRRDS
jgi:hypothetical protein